MKTKFCIIGAGVIGLSIAKELVSKGYKNILIIEKEATVAEHASGRNSGVLHAGIYYNSAHLKQFCLEGNRMWQSFCEDNSLPLLKTGKVLVAKNKQEVEILHTLYDQAIQNGASVEIVPKSKVSHYEPLAKTVDSALVSHSTAIVNPKRCLETLETRLKNNDSVTFKFNTKVKEINKQSLKTNHEIIHFDFLINAGAFSDQLAVQSGVSKNINYFL